MILFQKKLGETPLEMIDRLRIERPELASEKLSYAGRLDPMAEGESVIIVGAENKERQKFLNYDKEYIATFLFGIKTDTNDILGIIKDSDKNVGAIDNFSDNISKTIRLFEKIKEQTYPWFSGKTVSGIKLFEYAKNGINTIVRPKIKVEIKNIEIISFGNIKRDNLKKYVVESVSLVKGDFRQKEILNSWNIFFENDKRENFVICEVKLLVSSGTYIRNLCDEFNYPTVLLKLKRTRVLV